MIARGLTRRDLRSKKSTSPTPSDARLSQCYKLPIFASSHWLSGARLSHSTIRTNADLCSALHSQPVSSQALASVSTRISLTSANIHPWLAVNFGRTLSIIEISTEFIVAFRPNPMMPVAIADAGKVTCTRRLLRTCCGMRKVGWADFADLDKDMLSEEMPPCSFDHYLCMTRSFANSSVTAQIEWADCNGHHVWLDGIAFRV